MHCKLTRMYGKASPTTKFANQFTMVAMVTAIGLDSCRNSSATINHGIGPKVYYIMYAQHYKSRANYQQDKIIYTLPGPSANRAVIPRLLITRSIPGAVTDGLVCGSL